MVKLNTKPRILLMLAAMLAFNIAFASEAFATNPLTKPTVILTNMNSGGAGSVIVMFTTSATNTGTNGSLVFSTAGTSWTGAGGTGTVATAQTVSNVFPVAGTNCTTITGASSDLPGSPTAAGTAGTGTIAITDATALVANTSYCYVLSGNAITANPTATGQSSVAVTAGSDTATNVAIDIISNDQVVVGATVPPSFTFSLSGNTDNFTSNLSTGAVGTTTGITATVNTNAKNGWFMFGSDLNTGLKSTVQNFTIGSGNTVGSVGPGTLTTLSSNHEGYVTAVPTASISQGSGAGVTSASATFASTALGQGAGLNTTEQQLASSTGTANTATVLVKEYASISPTTPAATDYSDTVTLVAGGSF